MNKILNINLGGYAFTIDIDAYDQLDAYLRSLNKHFSKSEGHREIMDDIESRIAELFNENTADDKIIGIEEVKNAIRIMGRPEELAEEEQGNQGRAYGWSIKTGKRLFRDPENKVIGGVCSGLAAYFGIQDPIWVRLAFAIVFFTMGFGLLAYIILWIAVPEAKNSTDRLLMAGEKANVENIARVVEKGFDDITETIKDFGEEFQSKKKSFSRAAGSDRSGSTQKWISFLKSMVSGIINVLRSLARKIVRKADDFV